MDRALTEQIKAEMLNAGLDLVGFGPVSRWKNAPYLLSPQAILPESKTVVVGAIHITDTWTEMGGEPHPQGRSPGGWMDQNGLLDHIAYKVTRFIADHGYKAIPVASSNIWRYRKYEGIPSLFAPDLSHMHAAAAAGLAEIGWSGLAITPEFGSRCRFISIVTDAELVPTPMYSGPKLCDMCGECVRACPTAAMRKDFNSKEPHVVEIGGKVYKYANKNMWRCAWAEHFNLDLDAEALRAKEHIGEEEIKAALDAKQLRGHERGVCQKVCVPPHLRSKNPSFGRSDKMIAQNRINRRYPDHMPTLRKLRDDIIARAIQLGAEVAAVAPLDGSAKAGKLALSDAPGMRTVIAVAMRKPPESDGLKQHEDYAPYHYALFTSMHQLLLRLARMVEDCGYHAASYTGPVYNYEAKPGATEADLEEPLGFALMAGLGKIDPDGRFATPEFGCDVVVGAIVTDAPLDSTPVGDRSFGAAPAIPCGSPRQLRQNLEMLAKENLASLFGVAPASRFDALVADLKANVDEALLGEYVVDDNPAYHGKFVPRVVREARKIHHPGDLLQGARSVIVLGMHLPLEVVDNSGLPESQQIGCYAFQQFQTAYELRFAALKLANRLNALGWKTRIAENLLGIGSQVGTHRGTFPDARCNALEAVAAGLGSLGKSGALLTPEYGPHQRCIAIVTDAELPADEVAKLDDPCVACGKCVELCPMQALASKTFNVHVNGSMVQMPVLDRHRCDWSKKYALCKEEGPELIGNKTAVVQPAAKVTIESIAEACKGRDPIMKNRPCILETCMRQCPAGKR